jgi:hypothetical protein
MNQNEKVLREIKPYPFHATLLGRDSQALTSGRVEIYDAEGEKASPRWLFYPGISDNSSNRDSEESIRSGTFLQVDQGGQVLRCPVTGILGYCHSCAGELHFHFSAK